MPSITETLRDGLAHHRAGRLQQAEHMYRKVLEIHPRHAQAVHLLGLIAFQANKPDVAIQYIQDAIKIDRFHSAFWADLGEIYRSQGKLLDSIKAYQEAVKLNPEDPRTQVGLGTLYQFQKKFDEAIDCFQEAIDLKPNYAEAHCHMGECLQAQGHLVDAQAALEQSVKLDSRNPDAYLSFGKCQLEQGRVLDAIACFQKAVRLRPEMGAAHFELATALFRQGHAADALKECQEAVRLEPDNVEWLRNMGILLQGQGQIEPALACFENALKLDENAAETHFSLGTVHQALANPERAIAAYETALRLKPDYVEACNNLAVLYGELSQPDLALEYCRKGLELAPNFSPFYGNMGVALLAQGRIEEAIGACRKAVELNPHDAAEHSNYLYALNFHPQIDPAKLLAEHVEWGKRHANDLSEVAPPHVNDPAPDRRLRVGYVSPYFRQHAVNYFVEPILRSHDHEHFEIFCYSDVVHPDTVTAGLESQADHWRATRHQSDEDLACTIRRDQIDILVDLTGHIADNRLLTFARRPAPVQVTYIGYQNTTGMSGMDYRLTDEQADPPGQTDKLHTERLVRLPRSFFCYQPAEDAGPLTPLPAAARGFITFGSFNNFAKVTPRVIEAWWRILERVPRSRLIVLAYRAGYLEEHLKSHASRKGIDPARIDVHDKVPHDQYMRLVSEADIALDPFPFNGHTTTCDAIWQGVPVVMLRGQTYASRFGGSVLANVGLGPLMADSVERYVEIAVAMAGDRNRLEALRRGLRATMQQSALLDFVGFTRNLEEAYRQMWRGWCQRTAG
jgi:protein O-GlcNAc transferase